MDDGFPEEDPPWLAEYRIKPHERHYYGFFCSECRGPSEYATSEASMCRVHFTGGRCYICGEPMTCFGRDRGDYICEGLSEGYPESLRYHEEVGK